eukprot:COSAG02_NODE_1008_length_15238_cov_24.345928_8_plen_235_part_00
MVASAEDDTAQRFGRSVIGLLNSQLGGLQIRSRGFQRQGMIAQHAETLGMMADLRRQMRENAAKYGIEPPPEALEPEDAPKPQASHTAAAAMLARHNFATVDSFLGDTTAGALRSEVLQMQADGYLKPGQIEGGRAVSIRGDYVGYLDEDATRAYPVGWQLLAAFCPNVLLSNLTCFVRVLSGVWRLSESARCICWSTKPYRARAEGCWTQPATCNGSKLPVSGSAICSTCGQP